MSTRQAKVWGIVADAACQQIVVWMVRVLLLAVLNVVWIRELYT